MKKLTKLLAVALSLICMLGAFVGCGGGGIKIDKNKTQLYVSNYDAGIGRTWITAIGTEFEKAFAEYSFEEGKKGVQVIYNHNRNTNASLLQEKIAGLKESVFFTEGIDYVAMAKAGLLHDVSDIMNKPAIVGANVNAEAGTQSYVYEDGGKTIEQKINPEFLEYLDRDTTTGEKYYAFPYYLAMKGLIFDRELWDQKCYYLVVAPSDRVATALANNGDVDKAIQDYYADIQAIESGNTEIEYLQFGNAEGIPEQLIGTPEGEDWKILSAGPDGKYGTYDDGLPATFDEFYIVMRKIASSGQTPMIFTGKFPGYADAPITSAWWNYEGKENMRAYYSLRGTIDIADVDSNGNLQYQDGEILTESFTFANDGKANGYEAQKMVGKYYALQFAEKLAKSNWFHKDVDNTSVSHTSAQSKFLTSVNTSKRIAMLIDGAWWQQESDYTFKVMGKKNAKYSKMERDVAMMPAMNATIERYAERTVNEEKNLVIAQNDSFCVVNGRYQDGSVENRIAEAFVSFASSDKMLNLFSEKTNMFRAYNYEIDEETKPKMSKYGNSLIEYYNQTEVIYPYTNNEFVLVNYGYLSNNSSGWNWHAEVALGGLSKNEVKAPISDHRILKESGLTASKYFKGLYEYHKDYVWVTKLQGL